MKKTTFLILIASLILLAGTGRAQSLIAVQNGSTPSFYTNLDSAITHTSEGDTLYLPGGSFSLHKTISKRLHIIGVGHHPDSAAVTMPTYITGDIYLNASASGGSMMGIDIVGTTYFGTSSAAENYTISRCKMNYIYSFQSSWSCAPKNNRFYENVIDFVYFTGGESNVFFNNIFKRLSDIGLYNVVNNNIFLWGLNVSEGFFIRSSTFENNIFISTFLNSSANGKFDNNVFRNNLFVQNIGFPISTTSIGFNNIVNQTRESIFVNQTGESFDYKHDYHLKSDSPGKRAGRDGTDVGIYGGPFPWKEGSIPSNPHFQSVKIGAKTDSSGNLNVKIKVAAQDH